MAVRPRNVVELLEVLNAPYEHVVYAHRALTVQELENTGKALGRNSSVQYVNLSDVRAGHLGARALAKGLSANRSIIDFAFNYNFIGDEGAVALAAAFTSNTSLKFLSLARCNMRGDGGVAMAKAIPSSRVVHIDLGDNKIGDPGAKAFGKVLSGESKLVDLDFTNNRMGSEGIIALAKGLASNTTLTKLGLRDNHCGVEGAKELAKTLRKNSTLQRLNLQCCGLGDEGAAELAKGLKVNESLVELSLRTNSIGGTGTEGVEALADAVAQNTSLLTLRLSTNFLNDKHAVVLERIFETNQILTKLSLFDTRISNFMLERIAARLRENVERQKRAFKEALDGKEKTSWGRSKLMLIGEGMAGKSATVRSLLDLPFNPEWDSTIGVDITETRTTNTAWIQDPQEDIALEFITKIALRRMDRMDTKQKRRKQSKLKEKKESVRAKPKATRSTAQDLKLGETHTIRRAEDDAEEEEEERENGRSKVGLQAALGVEEPGKLDKFFGKARTEEGHIRLSIWDYGGQVVFHNLHHLFLTKYGVYLLVFNMKTTLQRPTEAREHLDFWLKAVRLHSPEAPLLITGTFLDQVQSEVGEVETFIKELTAESFAQVVPNRARSLSFYPIDNKSKNGLGELRKCIEEVTNAQEFVDIQVSVQWCLVLDSLLQTNQSWVRMSEVKSLGEEHGVLSSMELNEMLALFHQLGMLLYFDATQILQEIVTIRPQWLIDAFSKVIRDRKLHPFDRQNLKEVELTKDADRLFTEGVVTRDLLIYLWDGYQVEFLIELMRSLMLLSWWSFGEGEEKYLVPSMVPESKSPPAMRGLRCDLTFQFLPNGVFERLICLLVDYSSKQKSLGEPLLTSNAAQVWLKPRILISLARSQDVLGVYFSVDQGESPPIHAVLAMLAKLNSDVWNDGLHWEIEVQVEGDMIPFDDARRRKLSPWFAKGLDSSESLESPTNDNVNIEGFLSSF